MSYNIMIADDEQKMRKMLRSILSVKHVVIEEAKNGKEALEKFNNSDPDLVILDIEMPKMNGLEALSKIKGKDKSQKVIMVTGIGSHEKIKEVMERGADAHIVKPYRKSQLMETIEMVMRS